VLNIVDPFGSKPTTSLRTQVAICSSTPVTPGCWPDAAAAGSRQQAAGSSVLCSVPLYACWVALLLFVTQGTVGICPESQLAGPSLDVRKFCIFNVSHTAARFVCLCQILSYYDLTRLKRFVSRSTLKWCN
jgi:hypothetical protein